MQEKTLYFFPHGILTIFALDFNNSWSRHNFQVVVQKNYTTMTAATLNESITRLEGIKEEKHVYNKSKIAEAEALAAEALRMANEAKLAAARLAEVKRTLAMFSNKLETAEKSVLKDTKTVEPVVVEAPVVQPTEEIAATEEAEEPAKEEEVTPEEEVAPQETSEVVKADPSGVASQNLVNDDVVKVVEAKVPVREAQTTEAPEVAPVVVAASKTASVHVPVQALATQEPDIIEDFLDSLGVDKMCGVDDATLGFKDRPKPTVAAKEEIFENPTRVAYMKPLSHEEMYLHATSWREEVAASQRASEINDDFADPFGVDHDDLVFCGKIADVCDTPDYEVEDEQVNY